MSNEQKTPDETANASLMPTVYDQENPGPYIRPAPGLAAETAGAQVLQFPDVYDETNLPLTNQYGLDWQQLKERFGNLRRAKKLGVKLGGAALATTAVLAITAPGTTIPQGLQIRAHQIGNLFR